MIPCLCKVSTVGREDLPNIVIRRLLYVPVAIVWFNLQSIVAECACHPSLDTEMVD